MPEGLLTPQDLGVTAIPPVAPKQPTTRTFHGIDVTDDYGWLKNESYPKVDDEDVLTYLKAENTYFEAVMKPRSSLTETILKELKGRIKEDDESVPFRYGDWFYGWRFDKGGQYCKWYRTPASGGDEQIVIDEPALARGLDYFKLGGWEVSPDHDLLAWSSDDDGSERFTLKIKRLSTDEVLPDRIENTIGEPVWAEDGKTLLYLEVNDQWRPFRVRSHRLGDDPQNDRTLYEEKDGSFFVGLSKTRSRELIVISSGDHVTSEIRILPAKSPHAEATLIAAREAKHEYEIDHAGDQLFIRTNDAHKNFRLVAAPVDNPGRDQWKQLIAGSDGHYLRGIDTFADFLVVKERVNGLDQIRIRTYGGDEHYVAFPEAAYAAHVGANAEFKTDVLRLEYESMVTPETVFDYHLAERRLETRKVQEIPSGYDPSQYVTERLMAPARDGAKVPISIVYRRDFPHDGSGPLHLYGYGISPSFSANRLSLLDRGFAYAIAHIRGGDEMGYHWYEDGKLFNRTNTFHDFIDAARHLIDGGYTSPRNISISGGSAGGELVGAVVNLDPNLWRAVVAHVPFVDVLNTMLDKDLPLTPIEWPEWGNPLEDAAAFEYIRSYSPYDNVQPKAYPPILITAGLNDPRVTYWEPAKWTAKLRATKADENVLILKTNMGAGHAGKSGRFKRLHEIAEEYTFVLLAFGKA